jgi:hypothetical protein
MVVCKDAEVGASLLILKKIKNKTLSMEWLKLYGLGPFSKS